LLIVDKAGHEILAQNLSYVLRIASGVARIWIGLTTEPRTSRYWFCCSGGLAIILRLCCSRWLGSGRVSVTEYHRFGHFYLGRLYPRLQPRTPGGSMRQRAFRAAWGDSSSTFHLWARCRPATPPKASPAFTSNPCDPIPRSPAINCSYTRLDDISFFFLRRQRP
jgi:hypothetical protein